MCAMHLPGGRLGRLFLFLGGDRASNDTWEAVQHLFFEVVERPSSLSLRFSQTDAPCGWFPLVRARQLIDEIQQVARAIAVIKF